MKGNLMRKFKVYAVAAAAALLVSLGTGAATAAPVASSAPVSAQVATVAPAVATVATVSLASSTTVDTAYWCYSHNVVLKLGSRGACVKVFQRWNNRWGVYNWHAPRLAVDGAYGYGTYHAAVMAQKVFGLTRDGVIGRRTWDVILYALM